jgi:hypothetical protein
MLWLLVPLYLQASGDLPYVEASFRACNGVGNGGLSLRRIAAMRLLSARFGPTRRPDRATGSGLPPKDGAALPEDMWYCALQGLLYGDSPTARAAVESAAAGRRATRAEAAAFAAEGLLHVNYSDGSSSSGSSSSSSGRRGGEWPWGVHRVWGRATPRSYRECLQVSDREQQAWTLKITFHAVRPNLPARPEARPSWSALLPRVFSKGKPRAVGGSRLPRLGAGRRGGRNDPLRPAADVGARAAARRHGKRKNSSARKLSNASPLALRT